MAYELDLSFSPRNTTMGVVEDLDAPKMSKLRSANKKHGGPIPTPKKHSDSIGGKGSPNRWFGGPEGWFPISPRQQLLQIEPEPRNGKHRCRHRSKMGLVWVRHRHGSMLVSKASQEEFHLFFVPVDGRNPYRTT